MTATARSTQGVGVEGPPEPRAGEAVTFPKPGRLCPRAGSASEHVRRRSRRSCAASSSQSRASPSILTTPDAAMSKL